jgi:superfamily II RNA helicase
MSFLKVIDVNQDTDLSKIELATHYSFPLDPFQKAAIAAIETKENVLVTAKTGSGKTLVGEYLIHSILKRGGRVFYTTPIKSLSNQKFYDLKKMFGIEKVGIMTGDIKFNPDAQVIVMTTEILRNLLYKQGTSTESVGLTASLSLKGLQGVVFDEVHYINDKDRGKVWEETFILLPKDIQLVLLSATIDHPEHFAGWLGELKQTPIHLISTTYRIVPLKHGVLIGQQFQTLMDEKNTYFENTYRKWLDWRKSKQKEHEDYQRKVQQSRALGVEGAIEGKVKPKSFQAQMNEVIGNLQKENLLPALFFVFSRANCERYADKVEHTLLDSSDAASIKHIWNFHLHTYKEMLETSQQAHKLFELCQKGIAYHHSGLHPILKEIVEILFTKGFIKVLFATETFAVGLNMPTKTVIFTSLEKYSDDCQGLRMLRTDEYIQMAGRAGRRGLDKEGTVIYLPEREPVSPGEMLTMIKGTQSTIQSQMNFHYDFLLKTLQAKNLNWLHLMKNSYWYEQQEKEIRKYELEADSLNEKRNALGFSEAEIADLKKFDELQFDCKQTVNAKKKEAQRNLEKWKNSHVGPRWGNLTKLWPQWKVLENEEITTRAQVTFLSNYTENLKRQVKFLHSIEFIAQDSLETLNENSLTPKGILATEINEGHQILMPLYFKSYRWEKLHEDELLATLASFLNEGKDDEAVTLGNLDVPIATKEAIYDIDDLVVYCRNKENESGSTSPEGFWNCNISWVEPIYKWYQGATINSLCEQYGFFEGNFVRVLNKVRNLVEEWQVLGTLSNSVEAVEMCQKLDRMFAKEVQCVESLYLRL